MTEAPHTAIQRAILFADIVGSTSLYERLGDVIARNLTGKVLARMREIVAEKQGQVAAELGDELMCFFPQPASAAAAACEMHARIGEEFPIPESDSHIKLRIGIHYGVAGGDKDDLMSESAKIAHWAASNAKADQTLATVSVIDALPRIFRAVSRYVDDETWNFVSFAHVSLYEIIWDLESITAAAMTPAPASPGRYTQVIFSCVGNMVIINAEHPVISVGRGTQNNLVVTHELASRQHFTAQFSRGRCTITDKSTNGTLLIDDSRGVHQTVRRDTVALQGQGTVVVGTQDTDDLTAVIVYRCE
jgi:adenylate cyclase